MEIAIKLSQFLLSLSILIILHELGHFIPAKLFKTRVEKFYLFFDIKYSLLKKKIGETEYGIGWLPLGGYVKISGMIDESMDTEQMAQEPQPWEFRSKPAWQRLIIMLGGVTVNFILAFIIYIGMAYAYGEQFIANNDLKEGVWVTNPVIEKAGIKTGDKIVSINGKPMDRFNDLAKNLYTAREVVVERNGQQQTIKFPINIINQISNSGRKHSLVELRIPFVVSEVSKSSPNNSTLKSKDIITSFNGKPVRYADEIISEFDKFKGQTVPVVVKRDNQLVATTIKFNDSAKLGVVYPNRIPLSNIEKLNLYKVNKHEYGFFESIPVGLRVGAETLIGYGENLMTIFNPKTEAYKEVGGFAAIFNIFPNSWSWEAFWNITALLSIMLGVMNLLPIPALDGGHVMFLLYEIISGRKPSDKFLEKAQLVGFVLLISLLLFANGNDIYKAIVGK
ncbi:RIP metalloprotease RseP [Flavobacterium sp. J49]|uniref:RIP metalloprotease RseP n=1 Tax=Flavobacterium sp. J49 TaxID=2718534 RepID=UPI0015932862|nr:RIP metalloprotease RseP [Flavobacterium sp. J49]MBF6641664.1 RIP metalloprotease RseP [Flavobacterium sp. J49]NIC02911.1 RIP metalloprotease RseP [Flavobacterium sp. J49]